MRVSGEAAARVGPPLEALAMWAEACLRQSPEEHQQAAAELKRSYGMRATWGEHLERETVAGEARWGLRHCRHRQSVVNLARTCVGGATLSTRLKHASLMY